MADDRKDKKDKKKEGGDNGVDSGTFIAEIVFIIVILIIVGNFVLPPVLRVTTAIHDLRFPALTGRAAEINYAVLSFLEILGIASFFGIGYTLVRMGMIRKEKIAKAIDFSTAPLSKAEERWQYILSLAGSHNQSDWKVAIIEADSILDEIVTRMGYGGETLGEKLKNIEASDFITLNDAWEAHKFRNRIAHADGDINQREVRKNLELFRRVFEEFDYI